MAGNGVPGPGIPSRVRRWHGMLVGPAPVPGNPFGFGMPQPAAAAAAAAAAPAENPAAQEGFNPPRPFLDPIQDWMQQHRDELRDRGVLRQSGLVDVLAGPSTVMSVASVQAVVLGLLKRVTDLERQTDNMDRAIMQLRNPNARGGRRTRRHTRRHPHTL